VGRFGRKHEEQSSVEVAPPPAPSAIPDYGFNAGYTRAPKTVSDIVRTTSYPGDMEGTARFVYRERTTSYRQPTYKDRRVFETIN